MDEAVELEAQLREQLHEQQGSLAEVAALLAADPGSEEVQQLHAQLVEAVGQLQAALLDLKKQRMLLQVDSLHGGGGGGAAGVEAAAAADAEHAAAEGAPGGRRVGQEEFADGAAGVSGGFHYSNGREHRQREDDVSSDEGSGASGSGSGSYSSYSSGSGSGSESEEEEAHGGLGLGSSALDHAREAAAAGPQTETQRFADWEGHGRGIASKLLARMGYKAGEGLGREGEGILEPVTAELLPKQQGLGHRTHHHRHRRHHKGRHRGEAGDGQGGEGGEEGGAGGGGRKRSRGGEKARRRKHAAAARAAKEARRDEAAAGELAGEGPGLFSFINGALGEGSEAAAKLRSALGQPQVAVGAGAGGGGGGVPGGGMGKGAAAAAGGSRRDLVAHADNIAALKAKVQQLEAMAARNRGNAGLAPQIAAKLAEAKGELAAAQGAARAANKAVNDKEAAKRWVKF